MANLTRDAQADLAFAVLSDLHMTHRGEGLQKLCQHLDMYSRMTPAIDAHVFAGDIIYQTDLSGGAVCQEVYEAPYTYLQIALDRYAKDVPLVYTIGNHEYPQNRHDPEIMDEARAVYEKNGYRRLDHQVINGYHFISVGIYNWDCAYLPEDEAWAMKEIRSALRKSGDRPVFVVYHVPPRNTVKHSAHSGHSEEFLKFLLGNRRIINLVGHTHVTAEDPFTIWQRPGGATVIHAPMAGVGYIYAGGDNPQYLTVYQSRSLFFEVKGNTVLIHKMDNLSETEIGKPWIVEIGGKQYYTDARVKRAKKPAFPVGASAEARAYVVPGGVAFTFPKAVCPETEGHDDSTVPVYRFTFCKDGEVVYTCTRHSDFCDSHPGERFEGIVPVSLTDGLYTVRISPISFFEKEGRPISVKVRVHGEIPAALHNPVANAFALI